MATSKTTANKSAPKSAKATSSDIDPTRVGKETLDDNQGNMAQNAVNRVKEAMPSLDDVKETLHDRTNVDFQNMADDAATFVRRNPAVSLAAAAGIGVLIGILATKRS